MTTGIPMIESDGSRRTRRRTTASSSVQVVNLNSEGRGRSQPQPDTLDRSFGSALDLRKAGVEFNAR